MDACTGDGQDVCGVHMNESNLTGVNKTWTTQRNWDIYYFIFESCYNGLEVYENFLFETQSGEHTSQWQIEDTQTMPKFSTFARVRYATLKTCRKRDFSKLVTCKFQLGLTWFRNMMNNVWLAISTTWKTNCLGWLWWTGVWALLF